MILRTSPRRCHHRSHRRRRGAIFNEPFPRPADFLFFNHIEGPVLVFRHRGEVFEHSEDRLSNSLPDKIFGYVQESIWSAHPYLTLSGRRTGLHNWHCFPCVRHQRGDVCWARRCLFVNNPKTLFGGRACWAVTLCKASLRTRPLEV
jgi:hypothetical protein